MNADVALLQGVTVGLAIAVPVGPIALLCIRRTLAQGAAAGVASGLGTATAHGLYSLVAVQGLTAIAVVLDDHSLVLQVAGGVLLAVLGALTLRRAITGAPSAARGGPACGGVVQAFGTGLGLTLSNPVTILYFSGVVVALAAPDAPGRGSEFVVGVFAGSLAWWLVLVTGIATVRQRLPALALRWVTGMSGGLLVLFGAASALAGVRL